MPLPMVHLLLAEKIGQLAGKEPDAYFLLGSIAPDAIHMRLGSVRKDKHRTHFFGGKQWDAVEIQNHWNHILKKLNSHENRSPQEQSFFTGYCFHTLLDMIWIVEVFNVLERTLRAGGMGFEYIRSKYYAETDACDVFLYQNTTWAKSVREKLVGVSALELEGVLTAEEILKWKNVVLSKMERYETAVLQETFYINPKNIEKLIDDLAGKVYKLL